MKSLCRLRPEDRQGGHLWRHPALVVGGIAAKMGLFKLILVGILAAKKFSVIIACVAVAGWFKKMFGKRKESQ